MNELLAFLWRSWLWWCLGSQRWLDRLPVRARVRLTELARPRLLHDHFLCSGQAGFCTFCHLPRKSTVSKADRRAAAAVVYKKKFFVDINLHIRISVFIFEFRVFVESPTVLWSCARKPRPLLQSCVKH